MKFIVCFSFLCLFFSSSIFCNDNAVYKLLENMSAKEKAAQVLMLSISGNKKFTDSMGKYYDTHIPGAFILFKFNFASTPEETAGYLLSVNTAFKKIADNKNFIPPMFAVDCEGGGVYRLKGLASHLPSPKEIAETYSLNEAENLYTYTAEQIKLLGIHLNLAPVVEVKKKDSGNFFGSRLYSDDKKIVEEYSNAFVLGMNKTGLLPVIKHFPGNADIDPHKSKAVINTGEENFYTEYIQPFKNVLKQNQCAVLISHVNVPFIEDVPFCFSEKGIQKILRSELDFKGLIITDDLAMAALKTNGKTTSDNAITALSAGCDMIMCSENKLHELIDVISKKIISDKMFSDKIDKAVYNILKAKITAGILDENCYAVKQEAFNSEKFNTAKQNAVKILKK